MSEVGPDEGSGHAKAAQQAGGEDEAHNAGRAEQQHEPHGGARRQAAQHQPARREAAQHQPARRQAAQHQQGGEGEEVGEQRREDGVRHEEARQDEGGEQQHEGGEQQHEGGEQQHEGGEQQHEGGEQRQGQREDGQRGEAKKPPAQQQPPAHRQHDEPLRIQIHSGDAMAVRALHQRRVDTNSSKFLSPMRPAQQTPSTPKRKSEGQQGAKSAHVSFTLPGPRKAQPPAALKPEGSAGSDGSAFSDPIAVALRCDSPASPLLSPAPPAKLGATKSVSCIRKNEPQSQSSPFLSRGTTMSRQSTSGVLDEAFERLDNDGDGLVSVHDLRVMLSAQCPDLAIGDSDVVGMLQYLFPGKVMLQSTAADMFLDHDDFSTVMIHFSGATHAEAHEAFAGHLRAAHANSGSAQQLGPDAVSPGSPPRCGVRGLLVAAANSAPMQLLIVALVLLDILIASSALFLHTAIGDEADVCSSVGHKASEACSESSLRALEEACADMHHTQDEHLHVEAVLRWLSLAVLCVFMLQILLMVGGLGLSFFRRPLYVVDLVVVALAIALEATVSSDGAVLVLVLVWRPVFILYALATTLQLHHATVRQEIVAAMQSRSDLTRLVSAVISSHQSPAEAMLVQIRARSRARGDKNTVVFRLSNAPRTPEPAVPQEPSAHRQQVSRWSREDEEEEEEEGRREWSRESGAVSAQPRKHSVPSAPGRKRSTQSRIALTGQLVRRMLTSRLSRRSRGTPAGTRATDLERPAGNNGDNLRQLLESETTHCEELEAEYARLLQSMQHLKRALGELHAAQSSASP